MEKIYENFHKESRLQTRLINRENFTYKNLIPVIEKYLRGRENILDVGCGVGTIDFFIANKKKKVTGIDISKTAISRCIKSAEFLNLSHYTRFFKGDFSNIEIHQKFDMVICLEVLEHIKGDSKVIKKIHDLLVKNGILILSVPSENSLLHKTGVANKFDKRVGHLRRYSIKGIKKLIESSGFAPIEIIKAEGLFRNFLFTNKYMGLFIKAINKIKFLSEVVTFIDELTIPLFGESDIVVVAQKK